LLRRAQNKFAAPRDQAYRYASSQIFKQQLMLLGLKIWLAAVQREYFSKIPLFWQVLELTIQNPLHLLK
jgi:hypothetical protein